MRVLVISCSPWRYDNNIGNSYTNIFKGIKDVEVAHICCGSGVPKSDFVSEHFHISEKNILRNLVNKKLSCGQKVYNYDNQSLKPIGSKNGFYDFMRSYRFMFFFWIRDIIWSFGNWKDDKLNMFIDNYNPDIIFAPMLDTLYLNDMLLYVNERTKKPLILYAWDDVYSLKQYSLSPFFWINKLTQRGKIRKVVEKSSNIYCISELQCKEYSQYFKRTCNLLWKGIDCSIGEKGIDTVLNDPIVILFTGNVSAGRWKTLSLIAKSLEKINKDGVKAKLYIYTATPITRAIKRKLSITNTSFLMGSVPIDEIPHIQNQCDILLHVESFSLKEKGKVRLSFSTKIVDYFEREKCIFAVGPEGVASIDYLLKNDAAIIAKNKKEIYFKLSRIVNDRWLVNKYRQKAVDCGIRNHNKKKIQKKLRDDFEELISKNEGSSD